MFRFLVIFFSFSMIVCYCGKPNSSNVKSKMDMTTTTEVVTTAVDMSPKLEVDLSGVMVECNDTFRVEMTFLESLNTTGSFPDETDKTPKCYLKCVLEKLEVMSPEGSFDTERVARIFAGKRNGRPMEGIKEMADVCSERDEKCKCEKAYNFLSCLFTAEIDQYETK